METIIFMAKSAFARVFVAENLLADVVQGAWIYLINQTIVFKQVIVFIERARQ